MSGTLLPLAKRILTIPDTTSRLHLYYSTCKREIKGKNVDHRNNIRADIVIKFL